MSDLPWSKKTILVGVSWNKLPCASQDSAVRKMNEFRMWDRRLQNFRELLVKSLTVQFFQTPYFDEIFDEIFGNFLIKNFYLILDQKNFAAYIATCILWRTAMEYNLTSAFLLK